MELRGVTAFKLPWVRRWQMAKRVGIAGPSSRGGLQVTEAATRVRGARAKISGVVELRRIVVELRGAI